MFTRKMLFVTLATLLCATVAFAQSSGNFTYGGTGDVNCQLNEGNGTITGGYTCASSSANPSPTGTCLGNFKAGIKTSSGAGNVFDIRPSMVVGLFTEVTLDSKNATSSSYAGVDVDVNVAGPSGWNPANYYPHGWVTYDARYIQISSPLFQTLAQNCVSSGGTGCYFSFTEGTVSAHSFDWLATNLTNGYYDVTMNWKADAGGSGNFQSLACAGPVNVTVQQNKVFSFDSVNSF